MELAFYIGLFVGVSLGSVFYYFYKKEKMKKLESDILLKEKLNVDKDNLIKELRKSLEKLEKDYHILYNQNLKLLNEKENVLKRPNMMMDMIGIKNVEEMEKRMKTSQNKKKFIKKKKDTESLKDINDILDKISKHGIDSLTEEEKEILKNNKENNK